jgi:hypothetical protein
MIKEELVRKARHTRAFVEIRRLVDWAASHPSPLRSSMQGALAQADAVSPLTSPEGPGHGCVRLCLQVRPLHAEGRADQTSREMLAELANCWAPDSSALPPRPCPRLAHART